MPELDWPTYPPEGVPLDTTMIHLLRELVSDHHLESEFHFGPSWGACPASICLRVQRTLAAKRAEATEALTNINEQTQISILAALEKPDA